MMRAWASSCTNGNVTMNNKEYRRLVVDLIRPTDPVEPRCPHAGQCGGCAFQDRAYPAQLAAKAESLKRLWQTAALSIIGSGAEPFQLDPDGVGVVAADEPFAYRTRMDYVATKGRFGLRMRGRFNYIVELETCHLIPPAAFTAAKNVWERAVELGLPDYNIRSHEGFLRYVVVRRSPSDELLLAVVTAEGPAYAEAVADLAAIALAEPDVKSFYWLLNPGKTDLSFGEPVRFWGAPTLAMRTASATLAIGPNTFFQNNIHLLARLLDDVRAAVIGGGSPRNVADLYGGVGTIALHLAAHVEQIDCVESVAESVELAHENCRSNQVSNVRPIAQEVLAYLRECNPASCEVAVADPPRTGLGPDVCAELLRLAPRRIVYVSCNPLTQIEDLRILARDYRLLDWCGYDMFPHTPHIEALAVLERLT
jgi:23S rRNA (uracil-5-)-methyltransferase RumA